MNVPHALKAALAVLIASLALVACSPDQSSEAPQEPTAAAAPAEAPAPEIEAADPEVLPEVVVLNGLQEVMTWLETQNWWGEVNRDEQLTVPHILIAGINPSWPEVSKNLPVQQKKALFYRLMLPLVMHANGMVMERREGLLRAQDELTRDGRLSEASLELIHGAAPLLPGVTPEVARTLTATSPELPSMIDQLLYRLDFIPAGLALGQAAYESGYGTSRFAVEGNSLFGQWTYGGGGIEPEQKRAGKGDYGIKAFDWPFDSVRGYFINLMSHPGYEDFRHLRAEMRAAGKPLDSLALADGLLSYSERGQDYVDSLKGMIRKNGLDIADDAVFRDEPIRFVISERDAATAAKMREDIERMRETGELAEIIARMRLD